MAIYIDPDKTKYGENGQVTFTAMPGVMVTLDSDVPKNRQISLDDPFNNKIRIISKSNVRNMINESLVWNDPTTGYAFRLVPGQWVLMPDQSIAALRNMISDRYIIEVISLNNNQEDDAEDDAEDDVDDKDE